jgi:hypothetical protein
MARYLARWPLAKDDTAVSIPRRPIHQIPHLAPPGKAAHPLNAKDPTLQHGLQRYKNVTIPLVVDQNPEKVVLWEK